MPNENAETGDQMNLIDTQPENAQKILAAAGRYKKAQKKRIAALADEKKAKQEIINLSDEAHLQPLDGGVIKFKVDDIEISITPRDKLVKVNYPGDEE